MSVFVIIRMGHDFQNIQEIVKIPKVHHIMGLSDNIYFLDVFAYFFLNNAITGDDTLLLLKCFIL